MSTFDDLVRAADAVGRGVVGEVQEAEVWIPGVPAPQGSKVAQPIYRGSKARGTQQFTGKVRMAEQRGVRLGPWRDAVAEHAALAWRRRSPIVTPLLVGMEFVLPPWKSTRPGDVPVGSRTGDLDKLIRAVGDGLTTAGVWTDDRLVLGYLGHPHTSKRFALPGEATGCTVRFLWVPEPTP